MIWHRTKNAFPETVGFYLLYGEKSKMTVQAYWNGEEFWFFNVQQIDARMPCANQMKVRGTHWAEMPTPENTLCALVNNL